MKINTFKLFIFDALKSLKRNKTISFASVATVAATLFVLGMFMLVLLNTKVGVTELQSKIQVSVFLKDDIKIDEQKDIVKKISNISGIGDIDFESKQQALDKLKDQLGEQSSALLEGMEQNNPMPNSYVIKIDKVEAASEVVKNVKDMPGVESVRDGRDVVNKIVAVTNTITWVGVVLFLIFIGVSLFLIGNTIKLTLYSRRREIGIMKYIGATDWFIRWPFIIEGMIIGLVGALFSVVILFYAYKLAYVKISTSFMIIRLVNPQYIATMISWQFIIAGIIIGALGSIISIRKFLAV